jgi:glutaredoxin 3
MNNIKVYTRKRCPYCTSAKIWLKQKNYQFEEISLDNKEVLQEFLSNNPDAKTVPQIFVEGELIGGFAELIKSKLA